MASVQNQAPNVDLFDAYFRRADLDRDGRISGAEAVAFFQGSGLSKQVLAQIWAFANPSQSGFLGRAEFYNALKLVTVAQSKRELTPEIVKAALFGPAASKIPAPQINFSATGASQLNSSAAQIASVNPTSYQNLRVRGPQIPPSLSGSQLNLPFQDSRTPSSANLAPGVAAQGFSGVAAASGARPGAPTIPSDGVSGKMGGVPAVTSSQLAARAISPTSTQEVVGLASYGSKAALAPSTHAVSGTKPSEQLVMGSKPVDASGNGFVSESFFGGDVFSAVPSQPRQGSSPQGFSSGSSLLSSTVVPVSRGNEHSIRPSTPDSLQSLLATQPVGAQLQQASSLVKPNQHPSMQTNNVLSPSGLPAGSQNSSSGQAQSPWPRMTQTTVQKYTKVFVEVDTDRDGKITGEQARNLFLSWKLPIEVLKQVWDLSDQDGDSMLSLREFCIALYLLERYREGRILPTALPGNIILDLPTTGLPATHYSTATWGTSSGFQQLQEMTGLGVRQVNLNVAQLPKPASVPKSDEGPQDKQQKPKVPVLETHLISQLSSDEQNSINLKFQEATEADKKVEELEKEILDSKEKVEFYRAKMQELVLYKSRCDNRLNEIVERIFADKHEVENLTSKYEDKHKQVGDLASKLTTEEATFRDIQEKKLELYRAIVKMEQDGGADGTLQAHAEHIQLELDELVKYLNERCKKYGLSAKPTMLLELPFGWQPGIQEAAADWDEDWDKFEDEGFSFVKELTLDVENVLAPPKQKLPSAANRKTTAINSPTSVASSKSGDKSEKPLNPDEQAIENGSLYNKNDDDLVKSAPNSPLVSSAVGSPSGDFADSNFEKNNNEDRSTNDQETTKGRQRDHGGADSGFSGERPFDEPNWGTFDNNDDIDSVWGFNASSNANDMDHDRAGENYFFGSGNLGLNPIRTVSPQASDVFQRGSRFRFDDSVPSTPLFSSGNSPQRSREWPEHAFDKFSESDSFSAHDSGLFPRQEIARFDSMRRSRDLDQGHGFPAFDDSDPFGSGPFRTLNESQTPRRASDNWSAF